MKIVFQELVGELAKRSIKKSDVAKVAGITPRTLYSKLTGETDFTLTEANTIHYHFFSDIDKETLFRRVDDQDTA